MNHLMIVEDPSPEPTTRLPGTPISSLSPSDGERGRGEGDRARKTSLCLPSVMTFRAQHLASGRALTLALSRAWAAAHFPDAALVPGANARDLAGSTPVPDAGGNSRFALPLFLPPAEPHRVARRAPVCRENRAPDRRLLSPAWLPHSKNPGCIVARGAAGGTYKPKSVGPSGCARGFSQPKSFFSAVLVLVGCLPCGICIPRTHRLEKSVSIAPRTKTPSPEPTDRLSGKASLSPPTHHWNTSRAQHHSPSPKPMDRLSGDARVLPLPIRWGEGWVRGPWC